MAKLVTPNLSAGDIAATLFVLTEALLQKSTFYSNPELTQIDRAATELLVAVNVKKRTSTTAPV